MTAPTVHLNGTSAAALLEGYEKATAAVTAALTALCEATAAVTAALTALGEAAPNARDYYPQGPGAWTNVREAHMADLNALHNVLHHLQYLHESVQQQSEGVSP
jgi:hypothetical protein